MRKAGKQRIRAALSQYAKWRTEIEPRIAALKLDQARAYLHGWADEVHTRIKAGELGPCTTALAASVRRDVEAWETGYYVSIEPNGARRCAC